MGLLNVLWQGTYQFVRVNRRHSWLLVIDVGDTNIVLGVYDKAELVGHWRISTDRVRTTDEYGMLMMNLFFHDRKVNAKDITGYHNFLCSTSDDAYA